MRNFRVENMNDYFNFNLESFLLETDLFLILILRNSSLVIRKQRKSHVCCDAENQIQRGAWKKPQNYWNAFFINNCILKSVCRNVYKYGNLGKSGFMYDLKRLRWQSRLASLLLVFVMRRCNIQIPEVMLEILRCWLHFKPSSVIVFKRFVLFCF